MSDPNSTYSTYEEILDAARSAVQTRPDSTLLIGIDGSGGSGKSTLASELANALAEATIVHIDDFADWNDDSNWTFSTFAERVLDPLIAGVTSKHQRYNWNTDSLGESFEIAPSGIAIIEGVTALRSDLRDYWHVSVWVECPRDLRLERGVARDGESMRSKWTDEWMPGEDAYVQKHQPRDHAQFVFDGSGGRQSG
jgi:uridine kinase